MVEIVRSRDRGQEWDITSYRIKEVVSGVEVWGMQTDSMGERGGRDEMSKLREGVIHHKSGNCFELEPIAIMCRFQVLQTCVLLSEADG